MKRIGKGINLAIIGTMILLYLCSVLVLLVRDANTIRAVMLKDVEEIAFRAAVEADAVGDTLGDESTREEQVFAYQQIMADNDVGLSASYPFRCVSFLRGYNGLGGWQLPVRSRNAVFFTVTWEDGTVQQIPMVFQHENSADVAQLLLDGGESLRGQIYGGSLTFTGYWEDSLFYIQKIETYRPYSPSKYESPVEPPEGTKLETIYLSCQPRAGSYGARANVVNAASVEVSTSMKSYGDGGQYSAFVSQWEKADELIDAYSQSDPMTGRWENSRDQISILSQGGSIFTTRIQASMWLSHETSIYSSRERMRYELVAEFSPLALAWEQLLSNETLLAQLLLFALAGAFLNMVYNYTRHRELRGYRDEIVRQERAIEYAKDAEQSRREMTSAIAHELKTPIAVLSSYAEALQENIDAEKQSHYLTVIREETGKMDRMVMELLDLSRLEAGRYKLQRRYFDLEELAREIIDPLMPQIEAKQLNLTWQVGSPMVTADRYRIGQVVENFMTNAIRHTPEGGKIVLRIGMESETFSVENQGRQIPQNQLKKVWETFWQGDASRNEKGSGLGLAICRTIINLHGGSCKVENTSAGVRFSMSLSAEKKLYQQAGRMPQEQVVALEYPIAQHYTTVERAMRRLNLLNGRALEQELEGGHIRIGDDVIKDKKARLYPNYVLVWRDYRITVKLEADDKRRVLLMERMRNDGVGKPGIDKNIGCFTIRM